MRLYSLPLPALASCPIAESVKWDLLISPGTSSFLFDQPLLDKVVTAMKEDSLISSAALLASVSKVASRGRTGSSGSDRYSSPLDFFSCGPVRLPQAFGVSCAWLFC